MYRKIIILLICIMSLCVTSVLCFVYDFLFFGILASICCLICAFMVLSSYNNNIRKLSFMLSSMEADDFSFHFEENKKGSEIQRIFNSVLNKINVLVKFKLIQQREKEKYYEKLLDCVNTGIIVVDKKDFILYHNRAALKLLGLPVLTHLQQLNRRDAALYSTVEKLSDGEEGKVGIVNELGKMILSIKCEYVELKEENVKILVLNNINAEIESVETETWSRLLRVLIHEIMNAVSPIVSLCESLESVYDGNSSEFIESLDVINKTSKGLVNIVSNYSDLTRINKPIKKVVPFKVLIDNVLLLMKDDMADAGMTYGVKCNNDDIMLYIDENQIKQVIINLIRNAIQAGATMLNINALLHDDEVVTLEFVNNGTPIKKEMFDDIFMPFYTTKSKGNGIGLSVSRQIMLMHNGSVQLLRSNEKETAFLLIFDN